MPDVRALLVRAGRLPFDVALLLLMPALLVAADRPSLYSSLWVRDTWVYYGYFLDLPGHLRDFPDLYYGSRLSVVLPGWLAHRWLPPEFAAPVLHAGLFYATVFSLFVTLGGLIDRRAAALVTVLFGSQGFVRISVISDYADGYVIAYFLLTTAALTRAAASPRRAAWLAAAGAGAMAMVVANLFAAALLPAVLGFYLAVCRRAPAPLFRDALAIAAGGGGLFLAFCLVNVALGGRLFFPLPSFLFARNHLATDAHPLHLPVSKWLPRAGYLVLPLACCVGAVILLAGRAAGRVEAYLQWQLLVLVGLLLSSALYPLVVITQVHFYAVPLLFPAAALALGGQWRGRADGLSGPGYAATLLAVALAGVLSQQAAGPGPAPPVAACFALTAVGVALPLAPSRWLLVPALALLMAADCAVQRQFHPYANFPSTLGRRKTLKEVRDWDASRGDAFRAVNRAIRLAREASAAGPCWFAHDMDDRQACLFDRVACYHCYRTRLLIRMDGKTYPTAQRPPGGTLMVMSSDPDYCDGVLAELARHYNLAGRVAGRQTVRSGQVAFSVTLVELVPLPEPKRG
ncbi:MAG: hypothetical protein ACRC33_04270 [Gemmataceae bacterium]